MIAVSQPLHTAPAFGPTFIVKRWCRLAALPLGLFAFGLVQPTPASAEPITVYPARTEGFTQSLNGEWSFKYIAGLNAGEDAGFSSPSFDVSGWKPIRVPGNWEIQGFATPRYSLSLDEGLGLYRHSFKVPANWSDKRRVCLRFDGVAFGFRLWVNGREVGTSSVSSFNPHTFDITDALRPGADNLLAVEVSNRSHGWKFDTNDDWMISGIFRDVTLFSVPTTHLRDVVTRTKVAKDGSAELFVQIAVNHPNATTIGNLYSPNGTKIATITLKPEATGTTHSGTIQIEKPELWTAETPSLYKLNLALSEESGTVVQKIDKRIGMREVSIDGMRLLLNGRPIKLRGVTHHDLDPITGRALSEDQLRRDLELMRKGNINFIRTSHYPPVERFIELCDELGFYVMLEVPLASRGGDYLKDPAYHDNILARAEATVTRDRNHPSVIVWSIGNENHMNDGEILAAQRVKKLDPTRPVILPKVPKELEANYSNYPEIIDLFSAHYPTTKQLKDWSTRLERPSIFTEYAHAQGLATERIESQWAIIQATPRYAGGSIWHFHDQGILRTSEKPVNPDEYTVYTWPDANHYYDTGEKEDTKTKGVDGADGIVYADRTPQTDFWEVRKVYSPVQIPEKSAQVKTGRQSITATVENRYDFRALIGMKLDWSLLRNGQPIQNGELSLSAPSHGKQTVNIPVTIPTDITSDVLILELRCVDELGLQITERSLRLELADAQLDKWLASLPTKGIASVNQTDKEVTIRHANFEVRVKRVTGELILRDTQGHVLVSGIYPHPGRKMLMAERHNSRSRFGYWPVSILTSVQESKVEVTQDDSGVQLTVSGKYPRPEDPAQMLEGGYQATITPSGVLEINYRYQPLDANGKFAEAGLSVVMPSEFNEFRWIGDGPYPGYPGKERLNEFGLFHLNRTDLRFQGNRRRTEAALLTTGKGSGVLILTSSTDVAVERDEKRNQTLLSHNAIISSLGNKIGAPETRVDVEKTPEISGSFRLLPLGDTWPAPLVRWFGQPAPAKDVFKPFFHSYDQ
ncbi:MAG: glycoside hydrolase family 2 TIM barrel-domain containing protein [Luteolibacter sp.]